ncbi:MAG TPA: hypothetical protein GX513_01815 [Firmicutes bacterium]|nr:hypothetical protein [Bacillota bacterium]
MVIGLEAGARAGLLADLVRGEAMWLSDVCDGCGGDRNRCNRLVAALASEGVVLVRKPERGDGRRRYLVLTEKGAPLQNGGDCLRGPNGPALRAVVTAITGTFLATGQA